jgi:putative nucleotidyltransferase with HDIG domain
MEINIMKLPTREEAEKLLNEYVKDAYLIKHSFMVAKGLEAYAKKLNQNVDLWYVTGILHDLDYYQFPTEHPTKSVEWFKEWDFDQELIHAISAHGTREPRVEPETDLAKYLIAVDEMTGLLYAYSLMRPTGFVGMEAKSALKKFKDKAFAAKIDRDEILSGINLLGIDLKEHIDFLIPNIK